MSFGSILPSLYSQLKQSALSLESIQRELGCDNNESSIQVLEDNLSIYLSKNFFPLASIATEVLAFAYFEMNDYEKWISYSLKCISPLYQRYLKNDKIENAFLEKLAKIDRELEININEDSGLPFTFKMGFLNPEYNPKRDVDIVLNITSELNSDCKIEDLEVEIDHSQMGKQKFNLLDFVEFNNNQKFIKSTIKVPINKPGKIAIKGVCFKFNNVKINLFKIYRTDFSKALILPYDSECNFQVISPKIGIVNIEYPIKIIMTGIPLNSESLKLSIFVNDNTKVIGSSVHEIKNPKNSDEYTFEVISSKSLENTLKVKWELCVDSVESKAEKIISIMFWEPFIVNYKLFNYDRYPISLKNRPILSRNHKYILVNTFEYNLPSKAVLTQLKQIPNEGIIFDPVDFDLPIDLLATEAFTNGIFIEITDNIESSGPLGNCQIVYNIEGYSNDIIFNAELPSIKIDIKYAEIKVEMQNTPKLNEELQLLLNIDCFNSIEAVLTVSESENYLFSGTNSFNVNIQKGSKLQLTLSIIPTKIGRIIIPLFLVDKNDVIIWDNNVQIDVVN